MSAYSGVRIVDFSQGLAGPMAAMLLGDFEAEIVKVEPPAGDRLKDHPGYQAWNRNKQVLTLDLATGADHDTAHNLISGADVALFSDAPGELEALGLDAPALTAKYPQLVHAWMPPYGPSGDWSRIAPHHSLLAGQGGIAFRQGAEGDVPVHLVQPVLWYGQAVLGAAAIGAALLERSRSGLGQAVTVSGLHGLSEVSGPVRVVNAEPPGRYTPRGTNPRYRLYQCADGQWFFLGTLCTAFYRKALEVLGLSDLFEMFEADMLGAREMLGEIFLTRTRAEWLEVLQAHDVPCAPVMPREAWFAGDAVAAAGLRQVLPHPNLGNVAMPGPPADLRATPASIRALPQPVAEAPAWPPRPVAARGGAGGAPLAGVRVLDLGAIIAGAFSGTVLANLGADVIKIETIEADVFRSNDGPFLTYNRGKRGLGMDLKQPAAREAFLDMVRQADVVVDNYRVGVRDRLGIGYAALKAINPRIISCSVTGYGDQGRRAARAGFDPLLQAEGGMMAAQGGADDPILLTIPVNDVATASVVAFAVIAALNARERTGEGQEILTSLLAQSLTFQLGELVDYPGRPANEHGARDYLGPRALHRYYQCADGWMGLVCDDAPAAAALGRALGLEIAADALAAPGDGPLARSIAAVLASRPREAVLRSLLAAGVAAGPVLRETEAWENPWLWESRTLERWTHPRLGEIHGPRGYAEFSRTPGGFAWPTPDPGEHTSALLVEYGISAERIAAMLATGAVFEPAFRGATLPDRLPVGAISPAASTGRIGTP